MLVKNFLKEDELQACIKRVVTARDEPWLIENGKGFALAQGNAGPDTQITNTTTISWHSLFEEFHESLVPRVSNIFETPLKTTNDFGRIYTRGGELVKHRDAPHCDYSLTVNFKNDPEDSRWAFFAGDDEVYMGPGDAYFYRGPQVDHWREKLEYDECWQWFFHFVEVDVPDSYWKNVHHKNK